MPDKQHPAISTTTTTTTTTTATTNKKGEIDIICVGLGRTGTLSLTDALNILGYNTYHYIDFNHHTQWAEVVKGERTIDSMLDIIVNDGYNVMLENPASDIYQDILLKYPNAKVILTIRDNEEAFVNSWKVLFDTMVITERTFSWNFPSFFGYIPLFYNLKSLRYFMGTTHLGLQPGDLTHGWRKLGDEWLAKQYGKHNQHVQDHVVKENQLLVFNVKEGWGPLCQFLSKDVPKDVPFPHSKVNTKKSLLQLQKKLKWIVWGWFPVLISMVGTGVYLTGYFNHNKSIDQNSILKKNMNL